MTSGHLTRNIPCVAFLCIVVSFVLAPMIATILGGSKTNAELRTSALDLPTMWNTKFYGQIIADPAFWRYLRS